MDIKEKMNSGKKTNGKQIFDVIIIIALAVVVYVLSSAYDILEAIVAFSRQHERWEIDEFITVLIFLVFALLVFSYRRFFEVRNLNEMLSCKNNELETAISEIKRLRGILPICAECKRIRDDAGYWHQVELYVRDHTEVQFSHSICPECMQKLYPDFIDDED